MRKPTEQQFEVAQHIAQKLKEINQLAQESELIIMVFGEMSGNYCIFLEDDYCDPTNVDTIYGITTKNAEDIKPIATARVPQFKY